MPYTLLFLLLCVSVSLDAIPYRKKRESGVEKSVPLVSTRKTRTINVPMTLHLTGVECNLCAQDVIDVLSKLEGVEASGCKSIDPDGSSAVFEFKWTKKNENIVFGTLVERIAKMGFDFICLDGMFYATIEQDQHRVTQCSLASNDTPVVVENTTKLVPKKMTTMHGTLKFDQKQGFILTAK